MQSLACEGEIIDCFLKSQDVASAGGRVDGLDEKPTPVPIADFTACLGYELIRKKTVKAFSVFAHAQKRRLHETDRLLASTYTMIGRCKTCLPLRTVR